MKFPVMVEEFIAEQEKMRGQKLNVKSREICEKVAEAANKVYHQTLSGECKRTHRLRESLDMQADDTLIALMEIVDSWCDMAFEQALEDRAKDGAA